MTTGHAASLAAGRGVGVSHFELCIVFWLLFVLCFCFVLNISISLLFCVL